MHLNLTESSAALGMNANTETERAYWQSCEKAAVKKPVEIDVHRFHDALGVMYPINWSCSEEGECETFMLAEMYCGNVAEIYARIGVRYFMMRYYSNISHAKILVSVKEEFVLNTPNAKTATHESVDRWEEDPEFKYMNEGIKGIFPGGISDILVPAMTKAEMRQLSFVEIYHVDIKASFLLSSGFWRKLNYSREYLLQIKEVYGEKYNIVVADGYQVIENGKVIARYGYRGSKYELILSEEKEVISHESNLQK